MDYLKVNDDQILDEVPKPEWIFREKYPKNFCLAPINKYSDKEPSVEVQSP